MQVGDLVRHKQHPITGVALEIECNSVRCLWEDGDVSWCHVLLLMVRSS